MSTTPLSGLAVSTHDLRKTFRHGANVAVAGLDLAVPRGGVHALLGPNGSGKTTALRMLLGLLRPDSGTMEVLGHTVPDELPQVIAEASQLALVGARERGIRSTFASNSGGHFHQVPERIAAAIARLAQAA